MTKSIKNTSGYRKGLKVTHVLRTLKELPVTRYWVGCDEARFGSIVAKYLQNIFDCVYCEYTLPTGGRIDIDLNNGSIGVEVKIWHQLYKSSDRALGQMVKYQEHYGTDLILLIGGAKGTAQEFEAFKKQVEKLGIKYCFLEPF